MYIPLGGEGGGDADIIERLGRVLGGGGGCPLPDRKGVGDVIERVDRMVSGGHCPLLGGGAVNVKGAVW